MCRKIGKRKVETMWTITSAGKPTPDGMSSSNGYEVVATCLFVV
jgi:hypothetical protein